MKLIQVLMELIKFNYQKFTKSELLICKKYFWIILLIFMFSCERELEYDFPDAPKKLVIHSLFTPDSVWSVSVFKLQHTLNKFDSLNYFVTDATVKLHKNGEYLETLEHTINGKYTSIKETKPEESANYYVEVSALGYPTATSETETIPEQPSIKLISYLDYLAENLFDPDNEIEYLKKTHAYTYTAELNFTDNLILLLPEIKFVKYAVVGSIRNTGLSEGIINTLKIDKEINDSIQFTFSLFPANNYNCCNCFYEDVMLFNEMDFIVCAMSDSYYLFNRDLENQVNSMNDIFLASQNIYSNINNGVGIFAATSKRDTVKLPFKLPSEDLFTINCN